MHVIMQSKRRTEADGACLPVLLIQTRTAKINTCFTRKRIYNRVYIENSTYVHWKPQPCTCLALTKTRRIWETNPSIEMSPHLIWCLECLRTTAFREGSLSWQINQSSCTIDRGSRDTVCIHDHFYLLLIYIRWSSIGVLRQITMQCLRGIVSSIQFNNFNFSLSYYLKICQNIISFSSFRRARLAYAHICAYVPMYRAIVRVLTS